MASIFKRGRDSRKRRAYWYIAFSDHEGRRRTRKGFTDKGATEQLAAKLEHEAMLRSRGLIDPQQERLASQKSSSLDGHLEAFEKSLDANTAKYNKLVVSRVKKIIKGCNFATVADLQPEPVEAFLRGLKQTENIGHRTYNHYLQAIDAFCNWMVSARRIPFKPLVGLERLNPDVDVRHPRRALTPEEVKRLVESARKSSKEIQCFSGEIRARLYLLSFMTGLRRTELASLTPRSFDLDSKQPILTVKATVSKHRKQDVLPLHPELVVMLRDWLTGMAPDEPLFPGLSRKRTWYMVRKDLERVGIPYETPDGIADFHAAGRHTYITQLLRSGASLPEAKELARHADVKMTMRYTHIGIEDQAKALGRLSWQRIGSDPGRVDSHSVTSPDTDDGPSSIAESNATHDQDATSDTPRHSVALADTSQVQLPERVRFPLGVHFSGRGKVWPVFN